MITQEIKMIKKPIKRKTVKRTTKKEKQERITKQDYLVLTVRYRGAIRWYAKIVTWLLNQAQNTPQEIIQLIREESNRKALELGGGDKITLFEQGKK